MTCQCPAFSGDGGCLTHRIVMTERMREQCRTSEEFRRGFTHIGKKRRNRPTREAGTSPPPKKERPPDKTPADLPCIYRGEPLGIVACKPCQSRGKSGAETWACALHFRCTMHNVSPRTGVKPVACITCDQRIPLQPSGPARTP